MFEILKEKYPKHEILLERIGSALQTDKDLKEFFSLIIDVYEVGFMKAVDEHKEQLQKLGLGVKITSRS